MTETIFEKNVFDLYCDFLFGPCSINKEEMWFMTYTAASHQVEINMLWLDF